MTNRYTWTVALALAIAAIGAAGAQAQTAILNTVELQILTFNDAPDDHARLGGHFAALSQRYAIEIERHEAFAKGAAGNPNRWWSTDPGAAWRRLAGDARASTAVTFALAVHHARIAKGLSSSPPAGAGRFYGGEGTTEPTARDLRALAAAARTPADHDRLEEYYLTVAAREGANADRHAALAQGFRGTPRRTGSGDAGVFHDRAVRDARHAANDALAHALVHRQLAYIGS